MLPFGPREGPGCHRGGQMRDHKGRFLLHGRHLGGLFRRVPRDMFPMSNWRGPISTPQASMGQACYAVPQVTGKERQSLPSFSMAFISRCCMPSACDCWMEWPCLVQWDSVFLIAVVQWTSTFVLIEAQLVLASLT